jgi:hypothetical protein
LSLYQKPKRGGDEDAAEFGKYVVNALERCGGDGNNSVISRLHRPRSSAPSRLESVGMKMYVF